MANKLERKKKFNKRRKKIIATISKKVPENKEASDNQSNEESDEYEIEMTVDSGPDIGNLNNIGNLYNIVLLVNTHNIFHKHQATS